MECYEFLGKPTPKRKLNKNKQLLVNHLQKIVQYLNSDDISALKLTCQSFYYYFVTAQIWTNMKQNIAQKKLEHLQDYDFQQKQLPRITKKDKKIRIHSLKKQIQSHPSSTTQKRQSSNTNKKPPQINQNHSLLSSTTQLGFKRLLKTGNKRKTNQIYDESKDIGQIPKISQLQEYLININDPLSKNMKKTQKLLQIFKKFNQFHHRFYIQLKLQSKSLDELNRKLKRAEDSSSKYIQTTTKQPYLTLIKSVQNSQKNLLIDEHLSKVWKLFWKYHISMCKMEPQIKNAKQLLEKQKLRVATCQKSKNKEAIIFVQSLSSIDESVELQTSFCQNNYELAKIMAPQLITIYSHIIEQIQNQTIIFDDGTQSPTISSFSWSTLALHPFFSQTLFQILISITQKLLKIANTLCPDDLIISITLNRLKSIKSVSQALLNIARYFGKIRKQVQEKQRKGKSDKSALAIKQFLLSFEINSDEVLYLVRNQAKLDKVITDFKQKIGILKNAIQNN